MIDPASRPKGGIDRFLRRLSVRGRILGVTLILALLSALALALIVTNQQFIVSRLRQITDVETQADRKLLLASTRLESSRVNTMRYVQDYAPSPYEALDDVSQARRLLEEALLVAAPDQKADIELVVAALQDYRQRIEAMQTLREEGQEQDVSRQLFQAYRLGNDIGQRIEQIVTASETRVSQATTSLYTQANRRLIVLGSAYALVVILMLLLAGLVERSITRPVAALRAGAESFRRGEMGVAIPAGGSDELAVLARTFNEMATQVRDLVSTLEQRVADRTHDVERRAVQLATAVDVGRVVASILDLEPLIQRVVGVVRERFDLYYAALFLLDETGQYAALAAGTGEAGRQMKMGGHRLEVGGQSMVGAACSLRQARVAQDVGRESVRFDNPLLPQTRTEVALPLVAGNRLLGALDVQSDQPAAFSDEDITVLQLVADQVAVAIENARLFTDVQAALQAERRAYGITSRQGWGQLIHAELIPGYASDEHRVLPVSGPWDPPDGASTALRAGQMLVAPDRPGALLAPIRVRDQMIGVVDAVKPDNGEPWTEEELGLMQSLVSQLGLALDSARLYYDLQRRAARERMTSELTARMRETLDIETVLKTAIHEMGTMLGLPHVEVRMVAADLAQNEPQPGARGTRDAVTH